MRITLNFSFLIATLVSLVTFDYYNTTLATKTIIFTILSVGFIIYFIWRMLLSKGKVFLSLIDLIIFALFVYITSNSFIKGTPNSLRYYDLISCFAYYFVFSPSCKNSSTLYNSNISIFIFLRTS